MILVVCAIDASNNNNTTATSSAAAATNLNNTKYSCYIITLAITYFVTNKMLRTSSILFNI